MGDPLLMTVVGVGAALTKVFLRACDAASAADLVGDGQELVGVLSRALQALHNWGCSWGLNPPVSRRQRVM